MSFEQRKKGKNKGYIEYGTMPIHEEKKIRISANSRKLFELIYFRINIYLKSIFSIECPILRSIPAFVVGMPVFLATVRRSSVMPMRRFHENESPGMPVFVPFFLAIRQSYNNYF